MLPDEIKKLRAGLRCTARELATTLGVPAAEVQAWESGDRFPTKQWVSRMEQLAAQGPDAILKAAKKQGSKPPTSAIEQLDNPDLWKIVRKLLVHPTLFADVSKLAASYDDPAATTK